MDVDFSKVLSSQLLYSRVDALELLHQSKVEKGPGEAVEGVGDSLSDKPVTDGMVGISEDVQHFFMEEGEEQEILELPLTAPGVLFYPVNLFLVCNRTGCFIEEFDELIPHWA